VSTKRSSDWLALNEALQAILYRGRLATAPLRRLEDIKERAVDFIESDPDDSLFCLFQAMGDDRLGYCATHALQCAAVCKLTAENLALPLAQRDSLVNAALTMNIGMAREQDLMTRQITALNAEQKTIILEHPQKSADILRGFGISDEDQLDMVLWHHSEDDREGLPQTRPGRQILRMADLFLAKMAARKSRAPLSPVAAVKTIVMGAQGEALHLGRAMAQAVSFYPPGSYVRLANGEVAVSVRRGKRANTPWVISIVDKNSMPIDRYQCQDTAQPDFAIASPIDFEKVRVGVNLGKMRKARAEIGR
jgi:HD-GYP domain-containing protein (c-di-GMP phosphodiesterase class II)